MGTRQPEPPPFAPCPRDGGRLERSERGVVTCESCGAMFYWERRRNELVRIYQSLT